jgi:hypothetical protein
MSETDGGGPWVSAEPGDEPRPEVAVLRCFGVAQPASHLGTALRRPADGDGERVDDVMSKPGLSSVPMPCRLMGPEYSSYALSVCLPLTSRVAAQHRSGSLLGIVWDPPWAEALPVVRVRADAQGLLAADGDS